MRRGVIIRTVINGPTFDGATTDPTQQAVRDSLIAFMSALSRAHAEANKEARRAGIEHAKMKSPEAYLGRKPSYTREQLELVATLLAREASTSAIARETGLSRQTVLRIKDEPADAERVLARWETRDEERKRGRSEAA